MSETKHTLTPEDKQRIEQYIEQYDQNQHWPFRLSEIEKVALRAGAEYATLYEREVWIKQCEELIRTRNVMSEGYKLEIKRLEAERTELQGRVDTAYDWLRQYNEELKSTNVFHKNEAIIGRITKLLNSIKTITIR